MNRKAMVRLAGIAGPRRQLMTLIAYELDRSYMAFGRALSNRLWGFAPKRPTRKVSVPRSLRHRFGRYVEEPRRGGRKRKNRRKHNRRWMPESECECP